MGRGWWARPWGWGCGGSRNSGVGWVGGHRARHAQALEPALGDRSGRADCRVVEVELPEDVEERISHVLLGVRPLRLLHRLRAGVGLGRVEASAAGRGATARGRGGCGQAQRRECGPWARARVGGRGKRSATGTARVSSLAARAADAAGAQAAALPLLAARAARACGACRRRGRASSTPYRRRCRRLSPRRCRPRRPRGPRPPPTPPPTARAPTPPPRPRRRAGRPCRSGRRAVALGERARRAARRGALAGAVAPPVALRRRRARATRAPPKRAAGQLAEVTESHSCQRAARVQGPPPAAPGGASAAPLAPSSAPPRPPTGTLRSSHWEAPTLPVGVPVGASQGPSGTCASPSGKSHWEKIKSHWGGETGRVAMQSAPRKASGSGEAALAGSHSDLPLGGAPLPCARQFLGYLPITPVAELSRSDSQNERMLRVARRSAAAMPSRPLEQRRTFVYCAPRSS